MGYEAYFIVSHFHSCHLSTLRGCPSANGIIACKYLSLDTSFQNAFVAMLHGFPLLPYVC